MRALLLGLTHRQYVQSCEEDEMAEQDYLKQTYPHPYIEIWLECQRYPTSEGHPSLPEPEKGVLGQDAELMLAFDILNSFQEERQHERERRKVLQEQVRTAGLTLHTD